MGAVADAVMTRSFLRMVSRGVVGVLLFAQMAIAAYACPGLSSAPKVDTEMSANLASQGASNTASGTVDAMGSNCDDMAGMMDPSSANLCAEHCKYGQQSDHSSTITVPAALLTELYVTPSVPDMAPLPLSAAATLSALVAASPPHAILHCVFRI